MSSSLPDRYRAMVVRETPEGFVKTVEELPIGQLPDNDVLIRVHYTSLNYKDALSAIGNRGVTTHYPHTPGIDAAGIVTRSRDERFKPGDKVIVTSYDLGMDTPGGFGEYISVPADWIVPLPEGLTLRESMIIGSAGFTACYGVYKIKEGGIEPDEGPVVVTGSTGGVGSFSVALLSQLGYQVVAVTGKQKEHQFLKSLGASEIVPREVVTDRSNKHLLKGRWAAAVDTVGGEILDTIIRQTRHNGIVTCCGNVLGPVLKTSIYPFILRGVSLMGIDSGITLMPRRKKLWKRLSEEWRLKKMEELTREVKLDQLADEVDRILEGNQIGRVIVNLTG